MRHPDADVRRADRQRACALQKPAEKRAADRRDFRAEIPALVRSADHVFAEAVPENVRDTGRRLPRAVYAALRHARARRVRRPAGADAFARPAHARRAGGRRPAPPAGADPRRADDRHGRRCQGAHTHIFEGAEQRLRHDDPAHDARHDRHRKGLRAGDHDQQGEKAVRRHARGAAAEQPVGLPCESSTRKTDTRRAPGTITWA